MSDRTVTKTHVYFDEMGWPFPNPDLEWRLRYGNPTRSDMLAAAGILSAYQGLIFRKTQKRRNQVAATIKKSWKVSNG